MVAAPGLVSAPLLGVAGFTPHVGRDSLAAVVQSMIGNVAAGSAFALLQSAGAGGEGLAIVNAIVQGAGCGFAGITAVFAGVKVTTSRGRSVADKQCVCKT